MATEGIGAIAFFFFLNLMLLLLQFLRRDLRPRHNEKVF
jgi:hypothetical protein